MHALKTISTVQREVKPRFKFDIDEDNKASNVKHLESPKANNPAVPLLTSEVDPWRLGC